MIWSRLQQQKSWLMKVRVVSNPLVLGSSPRWPTIIKMKNHHTFICPDPIPSKDGSERFPVHVNITKDSKIYLAYCSEPEEYEDAVANTYYFGCSFIFVPESFAKEYGIVGERLANAAGYGLGENGFLTYLKCNTDTFWMPV